MLHETTNGLTVGTKVEYETVDETFLPGEVIELVTDDKVVIKLKSGVVKEVEAEWCLPISS